MLNAQPWACRRRSRGRFQSTRCIQSRRSKRCRAKYRRKRNATEGSSMRRATQAVAYGRKDWIRYNSQPIIQRTKGSHCAANHTTPTTPHHATSGHTAPHHATHRTAPHCLLPPRAVERTVLRLPKRCSACERAWRCHRHAAARLSLRRIRLCKYRRVWPLKGTLLVLLSSVWTSPIASQLHDSLLLTSAKRTVAGELCAKPNRTEPNRHIWAGGCVCD
jgi:hypothetical protein